MITNLNEFRKLLNEGLIKTYSIDDVEKSLSKMSEIDSISLTFKKITQYKFSVKFEEPKLYVIDKFLNRIINLFGYFPTTFYLTLNNSYKNVITNKWNYGSFSSKFEGDRSYLDCTINFEAKFTDVVPNLKTVYHWTDKFSVSNILKKGLLNRSGSRVKNQLERIYFFSDKNEANSLLLKLKTSDMLNKLDREYVLLEVDLSNLNVILQQDPEYKRYGIFTTDYIPPTNIHVITNK